MKKIVLITMQLRTPGGIERFISTLATMFSDNYEVEIAANYGRPSNHIAFPLPKHVKLTFLTPHQPLEISMKHLIVSFNWFKIPAELKRRRKITAERNLAFKKYLSNLDADIIITDRALYNNLISKYYRGSAKKIATDHNFHQNNPKYINKLLNSIKKFNYLVVATNELRDFYAGKTKTKCLVIPNPLPNIPTQKSPLTTKNIASVGRLVPEKDFKLLIDTMKIVHDKDPNIHLTIIGDGVQKPALESQIESLNLKNTVSLTGWLPQNQIAKHYYNSSLYVCTSKTEAFGLTLTEAMSYGLPCIALSRASGARAQITKNTGVLLSTTDPTVIADSIIDMINSPRKLRSLQRAIDKDIQKYSIDNIKKSWLNIL